VGYGSYFPTKHPYSKDYPPISVHLYPLPKPMGHSRETNAISGDTLC
jgi:hypothetical protein